MNELIKEMVEQAFSYSCEFSRGPEYRPHSPYNQMIQKNHYNSKLSELIIRECASLAYEGPGGILQHFGLEE